MRSLAVNDSYDLFLDTQRNLAIVTDKECVKQDCLLASQMFSGEFPYDTTRGVQYFETLFNAKNPYAFEASLRSELEQVPNVTNITSFRMLQITDVLQYEASIETTFGDVTL